MVIRKWKLKKNSLEIEHERKVHNLYKLRASKLQLSITTDIWL